MNRLWKGALLLGFLFLYLQPVLAQQKPNILVIWGDDVGYWNISAYNHGMMGYHAPNIDRIAKEGAIFTDFYAQQSSRQATKQLHCGTLRSRLHLAERFRQTDED